MKRHLTVALLALALAHLAAPTDAAEPAPHAVKVSGAWARATPPGMTVAAVYLTLAGGSRADRLVSAAKVYVGDRVPELVQDCVQIHGGIGLTWEHDIHLYLRRVTLGRALYGTPDDHRERLAVAAGL